MSLILDNLTVKISKKEIFTNVNLKINTGEIHLITGPNGIGKTSILKTIMGCRQYKVTAGNIFINDKSILKKRIHERVGLGITMSFQNPPVAGGISVADIMKMLNFKASNKKNIFNIPSKILNRPMDKLSGGEIKKADLFLTSNVDFKYILLDEPELSLDKPSLKFLVDFITDLKKHDKGILLVTHNENFIKLVKPDFIYSLTNQGLVGIK